MYRDHQTQSDAAQSDRRAAATDQDRESFRPVALPALAAAVQVAAKATRDAALKVASRRTSTRFQHEDAPLV